MKIDRSGRLALLLLLFTCEHVMAASYYVSTNGSDADSGTLDAPFQTIQKAASIMVAGDTCLIRGGLYRETVTPANSGTAVAPIIFAPYSRETVVVSGADPLNLSWNVYSNSIYQASTTNVFNQLFVDGAMMNEARWPNANVDQLLYAPRAMVGSSGTSTSLIDTNLPDVDLVGATLHIFPGATGGAYAANTRIITNFNTVAKQLFWATNTAFTVNPQNPYYLYGKLSLLDAPTEWFLDAAGDNLYLWTAGGSSPASHTVEVKTRAEAFVFDNNSFLTVTGLYVFAAGISMRNSTNCIVDGCHLRYVEHNITADWVFSGDLITDACELSGTSNIWRNSSVTFSSQDGIKITSGTGCIVSNCVIRNVDYYPGNYYAAVRVKAGSNHEVLNNTLTNSGRFLIWHTAQAVQIAYNDMRHGQLLTQDGGATYDGSNNGGGTAIHHNWANDSDVGIYLDNGSTNFIVYRNVCWGNLVGITLNSPSINNIVCNNTVVSDLSSLSIYPAPAVQTGTQIINNLCDSFMSFGSGAVTNKNGWFPPLAANFVPQPGSSAIDNGEIFPPYTDGYVGTAPDIGAYEVGGPYWTPGASMLIPIFPIMGRPATPTGVATSIASQQVAISWTESAGATTYNVKRSSNAGGPFATVATSINNYYVDSPAVGTNYYVVSATNSYGESDDSAVAGALVLSPQLILYEGFNYAAGTMVGSSSTSGTMNGGAGWSSSQKWFDNSAPGANAYAVTNPGLAYGSLTVSSNALFQAGDTIGAARNFNSSSTSLPPGTYYASYLVRFNGNSGSLSSMYGGLQIGSAYFGLGNTTDNEGSTTDRTFVVANSFASGINGTTRVLTTIPFTIGTTYLLVAKLAFSGTGKPGSDTYSLWVNPLTSDENGAGTPQAINHSTASTVLSQSAFYASSTGFGMNVDEFHLGTTWASVTPGLSLLSPTLLGATANGVLSLCASNCVPGAVFRLQSATGLTMPGCWQTVATNTSDTNGVVRFGGLSTSNSPAVFYRMMAP